jgi:hypothetical protein
MKKVVITFGLLSGVILTLMMLGSMSLKQDQTDFKLAEVVGYVSMIVSLSMAFFGIRSYRDNYLQGNINFGKAFQVGLYITLIASAIYVTGWMIYSHYTPELMNEYFKHSIEEVKNSGATAAEVQAKINEMKKYQEMYKNPLVKIGFTFLEIFPVGLLISLLCAAFLKKNKIRQAVMA